MKRVFSLVLVCMLLVISTAMISFADPTSGGNSLSDAIAQSQGEQQSGTEQSGNTANENTNSTENSNDNRIGSNTDFGANQSFVDGLMDATDLSPEVEGTATITKGAKTVAAFIVQVLSYIVVAFLAVRIVLDITYIALPFTRTFLANGYAGSPQQSGNAGGPGMGNPGMAGMGMGMGMGGYGGYGGMNRYGGMGGMAGMGGMGASSMGNMNAMGNQQRSMFGNIQFVSNAALNAVASESAIGPDGKSRNPFSLYFKDMTIVLVITPILLVLAGTGALTGLGFVIADLVVDGIAKLASMI